MKQVNLSNVNSLVEGVQLVEPDGRELRECVPRVTAVRRVRSSSCPPTMTGPRAGETVFGVEADTQNTPLKMTEPGLEEENALEGCSASMNQGDECGSSVRGMKRSRSDEAGCSVEDEDSSKKIRCTRSMSTSSNCSESRMGDRLYSEFLIQSGIQCEVWAQSSKDSFSGNGWDMCAQPMDPGCIPSTATPAQYLDICHTFSWGPFAVGSHLSMYGQQMEESNVTALRPVNLDPPVDLDEPVVNVPVVNAAVPNLGNGQVIANESDNDSEDSGNSSDWEIHSLELSDNVAASTVSDDGFDPDDTIIFCPEDYMELVYGNLTDEDLNNPIDDNGPLHAEQNENSAAVDNGDDDILFLGEFKTSQRVM